MRKILKSYWKPFLFVFVIYTIALLTMLRSHVTVLDDLSRAAYGYDWGQDWNRYTSSLIGHLIHLSGTLFDIAPISQFIGIILLTLASLLLTKLFTGRLRPLPLLFSTFIGLTPFMINAWQFHFDTPYIAFSLLASILPFSLYWRKIDLSFVKTPSKQTTKFLHLDKGLASFLKSLLVITVLLSLVWTSFQPANGIFLVIGLGLLFQDFVTNKKHHWPSIISFVICYIVAALLAYFSAKNLSGYRDISTFPLAQLVPSIFVNLGHTLHIIANSLSATWAVLLPVSLVGLIIFACLRQKSPRAVAYLFYLIIGIPFAVGAYLALVSFPIPGRTFVGLGFLLAIFALLCLGNQAKTPVSQAKPHKLQPALLAPACLLLYSFCTFAWSYGNALVEQDTYDNFRISAVATDLAHVYPNKSDYDNLLFQINGTSGLSATMVQQFRAFPVTRYVYFNVQTGLNGYGNMGYNRLTYYYANQFYTLMNKYQDFNYLAARQYKVPIFDCDVSGAKTLAKSLYHEIRELPTADEDTGRTVVCIIINKEAVSPQQNSLDQGPLIYHTIDNQL